MPRPMTVSVVRVVTLLALAAGVMTPATTFAYASGSSATKDCHEQMVWVALDNSTYPDGATPPPDEQATRLAEQIPVTVPARHQNLWAVSTVIGTRFPDFEGSEPSDFIALNGVHLDENDQRQHCLRAADQDDTAADPSAGSRAAVASCRQFILEQVDLALGAGDTVDVNATEEVDMWLAFVGEDRVTLQTYGFHLGQAMHALQDSFSHTVRTDDGRQVRHVLNYIEAASSEGLDIPVDGHEHMSALDDCELGTPLLDARVSQAMTASAELLRAAADGEGGREGRLARVRAVLDGWLTFAEGDPCVNDIDSCNPPELQQTEAGCAAGGRAGGGALALVMGVLGLIAFRRRAVGLAALFVFGGLLVGSVASAQTTDIDDDGLEESGPTDETPPTPDEMHAAEAEARREVANSGNEEVEEAAAEAEAEGAVVVGVDAEEDELAVVERREVEADDGGAAINNGVGISMGIFGSIDDAGFGANIGVRIPISPHFILGVDAEYDGWYSVEAGRFNVGALNGYVSGIIVWTTLDKVEIRSNIHAGVTVQLGDLYNNDQFSTGPMFGITPVAIAIRASRMIRVNIDPGGIFVEIPRISPGPPLLRRAHRLMVGITITP